MSESNASANAFLPRAVLVPVAALLVLLFVLVLFPWDSLGRRVAWEISRVSGARVEVNDLSPTFSERGPVLRATDVTIHHPAVDQVRLFELEIGPRFSTSWLAGDPTIRVFAESGLGNIDGILRLGGSPAFEGRVSQVEIDRLPLRLEASDLRISGRIDAEADVALAPDGTLQGRVEFESPSLQIQTPMLPIPIPFSRSLGVIEILETGATRVSGVRLEGDVLEGTIDGEIGLVHRSQAPPIDMVASIQIHDSMLRQLAPSAGIFLDAEGRADIELRGTTDAPQIDPAG